MEGTGFAGVPLMYTGLGLRSCAYRWTRTSGGGRWEHYLRGPRGVHWFTQHCAVCTLDNGSNSICVMPYMLALAGQPSLHGYCACMVCWVKGHLGEIAGKIHVRPLFSPVVLFFCSVGTLHIDLGVRCYGIFGSVGLGILARPPVNWLLRFSMLVGGLLMESWGVTHGDLVLEAQVVFVFVVEHNHVGNAGVWVFSMRGAPLSLPTFATAQFIRCFDNGRAIRCMQPPRAGGFMHLVVLYGYQGADTDAEQLALAEQLFDATLCEVVVVAWRQPCQIVGDFNVEPTKILCLAKGISAALWVDLERAWALASGRQPAVTCKRTWDSTGGRRTDFMVGCTLAAAAVTSCAVVPDRWIGPHLAVRTHFECTRWTWRVTQSVHRAPLWPASWLRALDKIGVPKSADLQRVWEIL